jgi:hypothetical protein
MPLSGTGGFSEGILSVSCVLTMLIIILKNKNEKKNKFVIVT